MKNLKLKLSLLVCLMSFGFGASAQILVANSVQIYDHITLKGKKVSGVSNDVTMSANDSAALPTQFAVKGFVDAQLSGLTVPVGQTYVVASQADMLALTANVGDLAVIPDSSKSYILKALPTSTLSNWVQIVTPAQVNSIFGRTGNITAQTGDYNISQITGIPAWITKVTAGYGLINVNDTTLAADSTKFATVAALATKVDKVAGKDLSTNDYTTADQTKLSGIAPGAEVNVNADWNAASGDAMILNKPVIPTNNNQLINGAGYITEGQVPAVTNADSLNGHPGSYYATAASIPTNNTQLTNGAGYISTVPPQAWSTITGKPVFATVATTGSYTDLINKPVIPTNNTQLTNGSNYITSAYVPDSLRNNAGVLEMRKNGIFVPQFTLPTAGTGTSGKVYAGYGTLNVNDSTLKVDTTVIASLNELNQYAKDTDFVIKTVFLNDLQTNGSGFTNFNGGTSSYDATNKRLTVVATTNTKGVYISGSPLIEGHRYTVQVNVNIGTVTSPLLLVNKYGTGLLGMPSNGTYYFTFVAQATDAIGQRTVYVYSQSAGTFYINYIRVQEVPLNYEYATKGDIQSMLPAINTSTGVIIGGNAFDSLINVSTSTSTVIGKSAWASIPNSVSIGELSKSFSSPYASSINGEAVAIGYMAQGGDWRAVAIGGRAQALAVSSSAIGYGSYVNQAHGQVWGRGGYNTLGGIVMYSDGGSGATGANHVWIFGSQDASHTNPAMPGGETTDLSAMLNNGSLFTTLRGYAGLDTKPTSTLTNVKGGTMRIAGGASTGTATGGNVQLAVTKAGSVSNNTLNPDFVSVDISAVDGSVKFNSILNGATNDSILTRHSGIVSSIPNFIPDSLRNNAGVLEMRKGGVFVPQFTLPTSGTSTSSGKVYSGYGLLNQNDSTLKADTSVVASKIALGTKLDTLKYAYINNLQSNSTGLSNFNGGTGSYDAANKRYTSTTAAGGLAGITTGSVLVTGQRYCLTVTVDLGTTTGITIQNKYGVGILSIYKSGTYSYTFVADVADAFGSTRIYLINNNGTASPTTFYLSYISISQVPFSDYATAGDVLRIIPNVNTATNVTLGSGAAAYNTNGASTSSQVVIGTVASAASGEANAVVVGAGAKAYTDSAGNPNGGQTAIGGNAIAGSWMSTVIGGYAKSLYTSTTAVGFGAYVGAGHASSYGQGSYNDQGSSTLLWSEGSVYLGQVAAKWLNPAMPGGGTTVDNSASFLSGRTTILRVASGRDATSSPTLTSIPGATLQISGGQGTGTAKGGDVQLSITKPGVTSNNTVNPDFVSIDISGTDGTVKFNSIASGSNTDSVLVRHAGVLASVPASAFGGGGTLTNAITFNNSGSGAASPTTADGSVARTISYNTLGAVPTTTTVNGHSLNANVSVTYPDIAAGAIANNTTATTQATTDSSTKLATTDFVKKVVAAGGTSTSSGIYTPTIANITNVTSCTFSSATYEKVGNIVTARITFNLAPTTVSTVTKVDFSLPINTTVLVQTYVGSGVFAGTDAVAANILNANTLEIIVTPSTTNAVSGTIMFQYQL